MSINLEKRQKIDLRKKQVEKVIEKNNLSDLVSKVAMSVDFSGSMEYLYRNNTVQETVERILPIAIKFDDNGELDFWLFHHYFYPFEGITLDNFDGYVNRKTAGLSMGGTNFFPVLEDIQNKYIYEEPSDYPSYVLFITDGDNSDKNETRQILNTLRNSNVFIQFVGLGKNKYPFLINCANQYKNVNFINLQDINSISDDDLYDMLIGNYSQWLKNKDNPTFTNAYPIPEEKPLTEQPIDFVSYEPTKPHEPPSLWDRIKSFFHK